MFILETWPDDWPFMALRGCIWTIYFWMRENMSKIFRNKKDFKNEKDFQKWKGFSEECLK